MKKWNWKLIGISLAILAVVVITSMLIFPQWKTRFGVIGAAVLIIAVAAPEIVDFLSKAKKLFVKDDDPEAAKPAEIHTEGGDHFTGNKNLHGENNSPVIGGNVSDTATVIGQQTIYNTPADLTPTSLHQLPAPPQDFTGREQELAQLCRAVQTEGVVLSGLRGMGGVGKTALALVLAHQLADDYPDAQLFVNLYGAPDTPTPPLTPAAAMQQVVRAFHPAAKLPEDENQLTAVYRSVLHGKKALILLDDARDAAQVQPLLPPPACLLLVTTRQKFTLPGLQELDLDSLPLEEAVALIEKITPRAADQAKAIAKACGCLPLALRLAASALREQANLGAEALLKKLTDAEKRFKLLDKVEIAVRVSYDLLADDLQTALRQLAVFPADFDQFAAAAVWDVDEDTAQERLAALINASLVSFDANTARYRLHDLVRAAAEGMLIEDEKQHANNLHATFYLHILEKAENLYLAGGEQIFLGLNLFDLEWNNIKAGQAWSAKHTDNYVATKLCASYPQKGFNCLSLRLHPEEHIRWLEEAQVAVNSRQNIKITSKIDDLFNNGNIFGTLGVVYSNLDQHQKAIEYHEQYLKTARQIGDRLGEGNALGNLGLAYSCLDQHQKAIDLHYQHLKIALEIGDRRGEENALTSLGNVYFNLGQYENADDLYNKSLEIARQIGDRHGEGNTLGNLGLVYSNLAKYEMAIDYYQQHLKIARQINDRRNEGISLGNLGLTFANLGQHEKAIDLYNQRLEIARRVGDQCGEGLTLGNLGLAYSNLENHEMAIKHYQLALKIANQIGNERNKAITKWNLGNEIAKQGRIKEAIFLMQTYVDYLTEIGHPDAEKRAAYLEELKEKVLRQSGNQ